LLDGEYPDLDSEYDPETVSLQDFVDNAWNHVHRRLWSEGVLPHTIMSNEATAEAHTHRSLYLFFKWLFRSSAGASPKWRELMSHHLSEYQGAWGRMNFQRDLDQDGHADSSDRSSASVVVHRNVPPFRRRGRRGRRW
jgi:hypothetical protein